MKFYFVMNVRFPTEKAHGWQIAKMCEALMDQGHDVELVLPDRKNSISQSAEEFYSLEKKIPSRYLKVIDVFPLAWMPRTIAFFLMELSFIYRVNGWAKKARDKRAIVFTRDHFLAERFKRVPWKLVFEMHDVPRHFFERHMNLARNVDLFVMTNQWKRDEAIRVWGEEIKKKAIVLPNAIDVTPYRSLPSKEAAKRLVGWSNDLKYVVYTGHFYEWKGAHILADASTQLPEHVRVVLIGGTDEDFERMQAFIRKKGLEHVLLIPRVPQAEVKKYLAAADCLALPNSGTSWNSLYTTSPIKLWEYLAAKRPVVASDLPSLRELVGDEHVFFCEPDNLSALAKAILSAFESGDAKVEKGFELAASNDWLSRSRKLVESFQQI